MNNAVIVTLADSKRINQAKQLFSSVYFNAGWRGDFLLLACNVPDSQLRWFKNKKILIKKCEPLLKKVGKRTGVHTCKLFLFAEEIKKWEQVVYLDTDIIVRASLDKLTNVQGMAAAAELDEQRLRELFNLNSSRNQLTLKRVEIMLQKKISYKRLAFNAGVLAFSTNIISKTTFPEMVLMLDKVKHACRFADQSLLNLYFYDRWAKLPRVYNLQPELYNDEYHIRYKDIRAIVLHFGGDNIQKKPWHHGNFFYKEWEKNKNKADLIYKEKQKKVRKWSFLQVQCWSVYIWFHRWLSKFGRSHH